MTSQRLLFLHPYLSPYSRPVLRATHARFYDIVRQQCRHQHAALDDILPLGFLQNRIKALGTAHKSRQHGAAKDARFPGTLFPRVTNMSSSMHQRDFIKNYTPLDKTTLESDKSTSVRLVGKITGVRAHGSKLLFIDVTRDEVTAQVIINLGTLLHVGAASEQEASDFRNSLKKGDHYAFSGHIVRAGAKPFGTLSLFCQQVPELLSPCLHDIPRQVQDANTLARFPQFDLVLDRRKRDVLRMRHVLEQTLAESLSSDGFTKVSTPIIAADTGGAVARPFTTSSTYVPEAELSLRIAPELGLKKLVAAGLGPVYEIGPVFRNEGLDATHNPEFTTCEFYLPYANLDDLLLITENLVRRLFSAVNTAFSDSPALNKSIDPTTFTRFQRLPFLPTLMDQLAQHVPDFRLPRPLDEKCAPQFKQLFAHLQIPLPETPSVAHMLDILGGKYVEPLCQGPTFITHYPAIMSPLAKSYIDSWSGHVVSARAELFYQGTEYVNMYEEENDPFVQAQKFLYQAEQEFSTASNARVTTPDFLHTPAAIPDLSSTAHELHTEKDFDLANYQAIVKRLTPYQQYYIKVLEMGLPPTAGWGCGIDRLVMLFSGSKRISEVLPFGNMRHVVAMANPAPSMETEGESL